ncbi:Disrupted in renal carcinoma protein 2 [Tupaia chinensis]|uniref:Disrupted in renal carcinoma protein 2 n=1 Tax=Tupaia chinensis TaxID=246437 RepID=L9KG61_TUPCH|nr:Disrupted in renal carcinoma protein 2 [Tupaia chinensis]
MVLGTGLRCIPISDLLLKRRLIHAGQILNGMAGPTVMNAAPFLSTTWFSADERATATAIASMLSYLGGACAFLVGPLVVPAPNGTSPLLAAENSRAHIKDRIETVLYAELSWFNWCLPGSCLLSLLLILCFRESYDRLYLDVVVSV